MSEDHESLYYQPKWRGRKVVRHLVSALTIGAVTLSIYYIYKRTDQGWTREKVIIQKDTKGPLEPIVLAVTVFLTAGTTWTVPSDCQKVDQVDCIGAGQNGVAGAAGQALGVSPGGAGGHGGAFARKLNIVVPPGGSVPITIGAGNSATNTSFNTSSCIAQSGVNGGTAAGSTGDTKVSGGAGAAGTITAFAGDGGGGGGAGGPTGAAGAPAAGANGSGTSGGKGDGTAGGNGGGVNANGSAGTEYDATHGAGGGGGAGNNTSNTINAAGNPGRAGGLYGAGGGGGANGNQTSGGGGAAGAAAGGLIAISYTPFTFLVNVTPQATLQTTRLYKTVAY